LFSRATSHKLGSHQQIPSEPGRFRLQHKICLPPPEREKKHIVPKSYLTVHPPLLQAPRSLLSPLSPKKKRKKKETKSSTSKKISKIASLLPKLRFGIGPLIWSLCKTWEPSFIPKLQDYFADFPFLHSIAYWKAAHLSHLLRIRVRLSSF